MNDNRYRNLFGTFGAFSVFNGEGYYAQKRSMVKCYVPLNNQILEQMVVDKMLRFQREKYFPIERTIYFQVRGKQTRHPLTKTKMVEFTTEVEVPPDQTLEWFKTNATDIPLEAESLEMGKEGWSVGPCVIEKNPSGSKWGPLPGRYVRVRFNKLSIPFYLSSDNKTWMKDLTQAGVEADRHLRTLLPSIMDFFTKNETEILARAQERPFNKSGIAEYEPPDVSFFNKTGARYTLMFHQGASNSIDKSKLADPKYQPVVTLRYGNQYGDNSYRPVIVVAIDDKLFEVKKFTTESNYGGWNQKGTSFKETDLLELDPKDEYVRERVVRALRSKL